MDNVPHFFGRVKGKTVRRWYLREAMVHAIAWFVFVMAIVALVGAALDGFWGLLVGR